MVWHNESTMVLKPRPTRYDRRRVLLLLALIAELAAAFVVLRPPLLAADSDKSTARSVPVTTATTAPPSSLVLDDGRTVNFLGLGGTRTQALITRVAAQIPSAVDQVVAFWGADWQRDIIIVASGSDEQFRQLTHGPAGAQWVDIAAAAVSDKVDPVHHTATGQRIVFAPGASDMSDIALRIVLRHELFHFASRAQTALDAPRWLTEGVADFVGRPATPRPGAASAGILAKLPNDADFNSTGAEQSLAYDRAWWFARFVADTYGTAALRNFYQRAGGNAHPDPATAIRQFFGADEADLVARWRIWLAG